MTKVELWVLSFGLYEDYVSVFYSPKVDRWRAKGYVVGGQSRVDSGGGKVILRRGVGRTDPQRQFTFTVTG